MSRPIDSILLPTDDSEGAIAGATAGIALASRLGADIHVLSVVELRDDQVESIDDQTLAALEARAGDAVDRVAALARESDLQLSVTTAVERGTPFQCIREYASRHEIDAVAMGTKGRSGLDRFLLGSVTENVLRTARTPVLAVPPDAGVADGPADAVAFDRFLVPTDGSEGAEIATEWAVALAAGLDSRLDALYSVDTSPFSGDHEPADLFAALEERGETAIESVRDRARAADVTVSGSIASGSPADVVLTYATETEVDLIVMGTHGRTGVGQWFLGSVTENVVRGAEVPVFCVPVSAEHP